MLGKGDEITRFDGSELGCFVQASLELPIKAELRMVLFFLLFIHYYSIFMKLQAQMQESNGTLRLKNLCRWGEEVAESEILTLKA
jgi:hypothetical protein